MALVLTPTESTVQTALRAFLLSVLPAGVEVIQGQDNRVPQPSASNFVVMISIRRERLATNIDTYADCAFIGSIAGTVMAVSYVPTGSIAIGNPLQGANVLPGTTITAQTSGIAGNAGTYTISLSQTLGSQLLTSGIQIISQPVKVVFQLDIHGDVGAENTQIISSLFRDDYSVSWFVNNGYPSVIPLFADDAKQMAFINTEQEYEDRWTLDVTLQVNTGLPFGQDFAQNVVISVPTIPVP